MTCNEISAKIKKLTIGNEQCKFYLIIHKFSNGEVLISFIQYVLKNHYDPSISEREGFRLVKTLNLKKADKPGTRYLYKRIMRLRRSTFDEFIFILIGMLNLMEECGGDPEKIKFHLQNSGVYQMPVSSGRY